MKQSHRISLWIIIGVMVLVPFTTAEQSEQGFDVKEQLAGTTISIEPGQSYNSATLSVVGPHGFEAKGRFSTGSLFLDLAIAGELSTAEHGAQGVVPDGQYRWEARLARGDGAKSVATGSFKAEKGVAVPPSQQRSVLAHTGDELLRARDPMKSASTGDSDVGGESLNVDDILWVVDDQNDKTTSVQLLLGNSTDGYDFRFWNLTNDDGLFRIDRSTNFIPPGLNRLSIAENGNVGLSTTTAPKRLTIHTTTVNDGIRLINDNISPGFETTWDFSVDAFAGLNIQDVETGNSVMRLREGAPTDSLVISPSGNVGIGTGLPDARLHVAGSGRIDGDVALGSSRSLKTAFDQVDTIELLAKVADLPLAFWRYKQDDEDKRHVGPFAEDFQRLFDLGDGETISVIDAQGVTLAAIQGLNAKLEAKETEIASLRRHNVALEQRLAAIERRLDER